MAEFCTCGSIVLNGHCTNKNCINKASTKAASGKAKKEKLPKEPKATKTKRASKCITYNLYDIKEEEENVQ